MCAHFFLGWAGPRYARQVKVLAVLGLVQGSLALLPFERVTKPGCSHWMCFVLELAFWALACLQPSMSTSSCLTQKCPHVLWVC